MSTARNMLLNSVGRCNAKLRDTYVATMSENKPKIKPLIICELYMTWTFSSRLCRSDYCAHYMFQLNYPRTLDGISKAEPKLYQSK